MKTKINLLTGLILALCMTTSCSITKMRYSRGFNIQLWERSEKGGKTAITHKTEKKEIQQAPVSLAQNDPSIATNHGKDIPEQPVEAVKKQVVEKTGTLPGEYRKSQKSAHKTSRISFSENKPPAGMYSKIDFHKIDKGVVKHPQKVNQGQSWLIALILCIFLGYLGLHRFYLGYPIIGIIQLLTLGFFGLWWLLDIILILIGYLKPKNGDYVDH